MIVNRKTRAVISKIKTIWTKPQIFRNGYLRLFVMEEIMEEYKLELKQIVDYPRCRMYRQFIQGLIGNMNLRGCSLNLDMNKKKVNRVFALHSERNSVQNAANQSY